MFGQDQILAERIEKALRQDGFDSFVVDQRPALGHVWLVPREMVCGAVVEIPAPPERFWLELVPV